MRVMEGLYTDCTGMIWGVYGDSRKFIEQQRQDDIKGYVRVL